MGQFSVLSKKNNRRVASNHDYNHGAIISLIWYKQGAVAPK